MATPGAAATTLLLLLTASSLAVAQDNSTDTTEADTETLSLDLTQNQALTLGLQSVGVGLLVVGIVALLAHLALSKKDKMGATGSDPYMYPPASPHAYPETTGAGYHYPADEAYEMHRNLEQAAFKYQ